MIWDGVLSWLGSALDAIVCVLMQIPYFVVWAVTVFGNIAIEALAALGAAAVAVLPAMPEMPELPELVEEYLGWVAWLFPLDAALSIIAFYLAFAVLWFVVSIALRWLKAV